MRRVVPSLEVWTKSLERMAVAVIVLVAVVVRLYKLNKDSLWFDEIGQVLGIQKILFIPGGIV